MKLFTGDLKGLFIIDKNHQLDLPVEENIHCPMAGLLTEWTPCIRWLSMFLNLCRAPLYNQLLNGGLRHG